MSKLGIYGGTFDPIHYGHLLLARDAMEQFELERIVFVPAATSPHKLDCVSAPAAIRLEMVRAAIADDESFRVDDLEINRPPPSYTIETVEELKRRDATAEVFYFIGSDNLPGLGTWHRIEDLRKLVQFVVLDRGQNPVASEFPTIHRLIDISATEIRNRVAAGRSIRYFVPPAVEEIIQRRQLYREHAK